jgi:hypothetical protein
MVKLCKPKADRKESSVRKLRIIECHRLQSNGSTRRPLCPAICDNRCSHTRATPVSDRRWTTNRWVFIPLAWSSRSITAIASIDVALCRNWEASVFNHTHPLFDIDSIPLFKKCIIACESGPIKICGSRCDIRDTSLFNQIDWATLNIPSVILRSLFLPSFRCPYDCFLTNLFQILSCSKMLWIRQSDDNHCQCINLSFRTMKLYKIRMSQTVLRW